MAYMYMYQPRCTCTLCTHTRDAIDFLTWIAGNTKMSSAGHLHNCRNVLGEIDHYCLRELHVHYLMHLHSNAWNIPPSVLSPEPERVGSVMLWPMVLLHLLTHSRYQVVVLVWLHRLLLMVLHQANLLLQVLVMCMYMCTIWMCMCVYECVCCISMNVCYCPFEEYRSLKLFCLWYHLWANLRFVVLYVWCLAMYPQVQRLRGGKIL